MRAPCGSRTWSSRTAESTQLTLGFKMDRCNHRPLSCRSQWTGSEMERRCSGAYRGNCYGRGCGLGGRNINLKTVPEETGFAEPQPSSRVRAERAGMGIRGFWWVMLLLLLDRQSSETANIPALNPPCYEVNGIQGGSVLLPTALTSSERVAKIEWKFQPQAGLALAIAEFIGGKLERPNPRDRFGRRLKMVDKVTLGITELELGDGGAYVARVRLVSAVVEEHSFTCRVYEPVPEPQILLQLVSRTEGMCNVTLQCLGSEKGGIKVSWKRGDQLNFLEGSSDWYQLSAKSTDLHMSWQPDSSNSTFTCLLSNPVDQKSASFHLASICQNGSESASNGCLTFLLIVSIHISCLLCWFVF